MVILHITKAGLNAALDAQNGGLQLSLQTIKFGSGQYSVIDEDPRTAMVNPFLSAPFVGGGIEPHSSTLRFNCSFKDTQARDVYEIGIFTNTGVLFAVASRQNTPYLKTSPTLKTVLVGGLKLMAAISNHTINILLDENGALALQYIGSHESHPDPHPQYAMFQALQIALARIGALEERVNVLENKVYDEIKVNDLYITTIDFANGDQVRVHKGYGKWTRFGDGEVLMTKASTGNQEARPWMKTMSDTGGAYTHNLTVNEMPKHNHAPNPVFNKFVAIAEQAKNAGYGKGNGDGLTCVTYDDGNAEYELMIGKISPADALAMVEKEIGGDQGHNNVQPSIVIGAWLRMPDDYIEPSYNLSASKLIVDEGEQVTFTLTTQGVAQGTEVMWAISGIQSADIQPNAMTGNFIVGADGKATLVKNIVEDEILEGDETLNLLLMHFPDVYIDVLIKDTSFQSSDIVIDSSFMGLGSADGIYYIKPSINLYSVFTNVMGRAPLAEEVISFRIESNVAILADNAATPAITVGNNWLSSNLINIKNHGLILGRGGDGGYTSTHQQDTASKNGKDGGTAIQGSTTANTNVINSGKIYGGGGGGGTSGTINAVNASASGFNRDMNFGGTGGAPLGRRGIVSRDTSGVAVASTFVTSMYKSGSVTWNGTTDCRFSLNYGKHSEANQQGFNDPGWSLVVYENSRRHELDSGVWKYAERQTDTSYVESGSSSNAIDSLNINHYDQNMWDLFFGHDRSYNPQEPNLISINSTDLALVHQMPLMYSQIHKNNESANNRKRGGKGGAWGENGEAGTITIGTPDGLNGTTYEVRFQPGSGGLAGYVYQGNVSITNSADGVTKGRAA